MTRVLFVPLITGLKPGVNERNYSLFEAKPNFSHRTILFARVTVGIRTKIDYYIIRKQHSVLLSNGTLIFNRHSRRHDDRGD